MTRLLYIISTVIGLYLRYDSGEDYVGVIAFIVAFVTLWLLVATLGMLAKLGIFFTNLPLNQYMILENMGEQTLRYIGYGVREIWVRKPDAENIIIDGKSVDSIDNYEKKVVRVRVHPDTGEIETIPEKNPWTHANSTFAFLLAKYLGIVFIGLPGAVKIKEWDFTWNKNVNGTLVRKTERVRSVFDTYPYVFEIGSKNVADNDYMETADNFKVYYLLQTNIQVTSVRQMVYGQLPSGHWIDVAQGEMKDIAKIHVGNKEYEKLRGEPDKLIYTGEAPKLDIEHIGSDNSYSIGDKMKLLSHRLQKIIGGQIPESSVLTFEKAKNVAEDEALTKMAVTELNKKAEIKEHELEVLVQIQKTLQSEQKRLQLLNELSPENEVAEKFIKNILELGKEKPELIPQMLEYAKMKELTKLKNLVALNTGTPLIDTNKKGGI